MCWDCLVNRTHRVLSMVRLAGLTRLVLSSMVIPYMTQKRFTIQKLYYTLLQGLEWPWTLLKCLDSTSGDELLHQTKSRQDMQLWIHCIKDQHHSSLFQCCGKTALKNALRDVSYTPDIMYHLISIKGVLNVGKAAVQEW